jgi:hypothetical protein
MAAKRREPQISAKVGGAMQHARAAAAHKKRDAEKKCIALHLRLYSN